MVTLPYQYSSLLILVCPVAPTARARAPARLLLSSAHIFSRSGEACESALTSSPDPSLEDRLP